MSRIATAVAIVYLTTASYSQQRSTSSVLLIEATQSHFGVGKYRDQCLWVRLKKDGSLEWKEMCDKPNEIRPRAVDANRVAAIEKDLNSTDWAKFRGNLGAYNVYIDSSISIRVRLVSATGEHIFEVTNPWPPGIKLKSMPPEITRTICQLHILEAQASHGNVPSICADTLRALECSEGTKSCVKP